MKYSSAALWLPIVQAMTEGKTIQVKSEVLEAWIDIGPDDDFGMYGPPEKFRVKPEPTVWYVVTHDIKQIHRWGTYYTKEAAEAGLAEGNKLGTYRGKYKIVVMQEVL